MATELKTTVTTAAGEMTFRLESTQDLAMDNEDVGKLTDLVMQLHTQLQLSEFLFKAHVPSGPGHYQYDFASLDGRTWHQILDFSADDHDPTMTFEADAWKLSEFALNRPIRDQVVYMHWALGVVLVTCDFAPAP
jgi:hypothetical protein